MRDHQHDGPCCLDATQPSQPHTKSPPRSLPAHGTGKPGIVHLFGGVFVGAVAEEMYRTFQAVVQSGSGLDLPSPLPAPTAPPGSSSSSSSSSSSVDGSSTASSDEPCSLTLPRGGSSPSEEAQQAAGDGEARPAGDGAIIGTKRKAERDDDGPDGWAESDGCTSFVSECSLPTDRGMFRLRAYRHDGRRKFHEPVVMVCGDVRGRDNVPVRVHDQCQTSEVFGSKRCDCKEQLDQSLQYVQENGGGAVIYLAQEGRGIGLANKVAAYNLQDDGLDTVEANRQLGFKDDERTYECVDFILRDMGIKSIRLMTNNPFKMDWMRARGVKVRARIPIQVAANEHNHAYLETKATRMSHLINNL